MLPGFGLILFSLAVDEIFNSHTHVVQWFAVVPLYTVLFYVKNYQEYNASK
jgi:hypothetical protein